MKSIRQILLYFFVILLIISCSEGIDLEVSTDITIDEVQAKFNSIVPSSSNARSRRRMGIKWDRGVYKKIRHGEALIFPIDNMENLYISGSETTKRISIQSSAFAFAYKRDGKVHLELVQPVPTSNDALFTGFVSVRDWEGEVKRVFFYEQGEYVGEMEENSSARVAGVECVLEFTYDCTVVSDADGNVLSNTCDFVDSKMSCGHTGDYLQADDYKDPTKDNDVVGGGGVDDADFVCGEGHISDGNGGCYPAPAPCETDDDILNESLVQIHLKNIWEESNAINSLVPMADRMEQGGFLIPFKTSYKFIAYPDTWIRTPCGIYPPTNWLDDVPRDMIAMVHTHPFYRGESTKGVCGSDGEDSYKGGPSDDDANILYQIYKARDNFDILGYVVDGNNIHSYTPMAHGTGQFSTTERCGY